MFGNYKDVTAHIINPEIYRAFIKEVNPSYVYFTYPEWLAYKGFEEVYKQVKGED